MHWMVLPVGSVIVQAIVPAGVGLLGVGPDTNAVNVIVPPSVALPLVDIDIVGASVANDNVALFEVTALKFESPLNRAVAM